MGKERDKFRQRVEMEESRRQIVRERLNRFTSDAQLARQRLLVLWQARIQQEEERVSLPARPPILEPESGAGSQPSS